MTELYSRLPEVGDMELPKLVFFFDEAHMLFEGTSKALVEKMEQIIRLIRSKGVGIYFITQSPSDIPDDILGQLGNRIQHALRAFTPKDQKAVKAAAQTFRANPAFDTTEAITNLGTGEALVSFLDQSGSPSIVQKAKILFPLSQIGAVTPEQRAQIRAAVPSHIKEYENYFDRESAYEVIVAAQEEAAREAEKQRELEEKEKEKARLEKEKAKKEKEKTKSSSNFKRTIFGTLITTAGTAMARNIGKSVAKSITGSSSTKKSTSSTKKKSSSSGGGLLGSILKNIFK